MNFCLAAMLPTRWSKTCRFPAPWTVIQCNQYINGDPSLAKAILARKFADRRVGIPSGLDRNIKFNKGAMIPATRIRRLLLSILALCFIYSAPLYKSAGCPSPFTIRSK